MVGNLFAKVPDAQDNAPHAVASQKPKLMIDKRPSGHLDQRFRNVACDLAKPAGQATGQDRHGNIFKPYV